MRKSKAIRLLLTCLAVGALLGWSTTAGARSSGAPAGMAGDPPDFFTCTNCHSSFPLNSGNGSLFLDTSDIPPEGYAPDEVYTLSVHLEDPGMSRWGFELIPLDDEDAMAGDLAPGSTDSTLIKSSGARDYITHTSLGTWRGTPDGPVSWRFLWTAPPAGTGAVEFFFTGNAANNNGGTFGDYIYSNSLIVDEEFGGLVVTLSGMPETIQRGNLLSFTGTITNPGSHPGSFDEAVLDAAGPIPPQEIPLYAGGAVTLQPGKFLSAPIEVFVPGIAPAGTYSVEVSIYLAGEHIDSDGFDIEVIP